MRFLKFVTIAVASLLIVPASFAQVKVEPQKKGLFERVRETLSPKKVQKLDVKEFTVVPGQIFEIDECSMAVSMYRNIDQVYQQKQATCNRMEQLRKEYEIESAIFWRLFDIIFDRTMFPCSSTESDCIKDCNISCNEGGGCSKCYDLLENYKQSARDAKSEARDAWGEASHACYFEGESLSLLSFARAAARNKVCEECGTWPSELGRPGYMCPMH